MKKAGILEVGEATQVRTGYKLSRNFGKKKNRQKTEKNEFALSADQLRNKISGNYF